jgi:hypothetical protein
MNRAGPKELAASMIRFYGKADAFSLAKRYAADCAANGDHLARAKWATAATVIGEYIKADQKLWLASQSAAEHWREPSRPWIVAP